MISETMNQLNQINQKNQNQINMKKSESIKQLASALMVFHIKIDTIKKDATNPFFKSSYASLSNILDAIKIPLAESDLSFSQHPMGENGLSTILMHKSGEWIGSHFTMKPVKNDPQSYGSCLTYMRRYSISAILGLNILEDDDGNAASEPSSKHVNSASSDNQEKQWLNPKTEQFNKAKAYLETGGKIEAIKAKYKMRKETEELLQSFIKQ